MRSGEIRSVGKNLDAADPQIGLKRVQDSYASLTGVPKTGGVDDIVQINLGEFTSIQEFHAMRNLDPAHLTKIQRAELIRIRETIPMPQEGKSMTKVILPEDMVAYLPGSRIRETGGFVSKGDDMADLATKDEIIEALRLDYDYNGSKPFVEANSVGIIEFEKTADFDLVKPYGSDCGGMADAPYPFVGGGLTGTRMSRVQPEYHSGWGPDGKVQPISLPHGAKLWELTGETKELRAVFDAVEGVWRRP